MFCRLNEQIKEKTTEMGELKKQNEILEAKATLEKENLSFIVKSWEENNSVHMIGMNNVKRGFVSKLWKRLLRQMEEGPEEARKPLRHNEIVGGEQQVVKVPKGEFDHLKNELRILQEEKAKLQKGGNNQVSISTPFELSLFLSDCFWFVYKEILSKTQGRQKRLEYLKL